MRSPCVDVCDSRVVPTFERAVVLEVSASVALPFPVEKVDRATWKLCQQFAAPTDTDFCMHDRIVTDDTINGVFSSTIRVDAIHGTMNGKFLTKRYKSTPTQRLFVTHMYCEPDGFRNDLDDVTIREDSWIRLVKANELSESSLDATLTMLQFVQRTRIGLENKGDETNISVADKAALFMARIEADLAAAQQTLDRLLM